MSVERKVTNHRVEYPVHHSGQHQNWILEEDFEMYPGVIESPYRYHDMMLLGVPMSIVGPETTIVLMSDRGFRTDHLRPQGIPAEPSSPAVNR
ncbi:hypothetical protein BH09VER1_BH09VER1_17010 [soil metagenome]